MLSNGARRVLPDTLKVTSAEKFTPLEFRGNIVEFTNEHAPIDIHKSKKLPSKQKYRSVQRTMSNESEYAVMVGSTGVLTKRHASVTSILAKRQAVVSSILSNRQASVTSLLSKRQESEASILAKRQESVSSVGKLSQSTTIAFVDKWNMLSGGDIPAASSPLPPPSSTHGYYNVVDLVDSCESNDFMYSTCRPDHSQGGFRGSDFVYSICRPVQSQGVSRGSDFVYSICRPSQLLGVIRGSDYDEYTPMDPACEKQFTFDSSDDSYNNRCELTASPAPCAQPVYCNIIELQCEMNGSVPSIENNGENWLILDNELYREP